MSISSLRTLLLMLGFLFGWASASAQAPDPQIEKVFADWKARQAKFKSIRYQVRGDVTKPKGSAPDHRGAQSMKLPSTDLKAEFKFTVLFDFNKQRHRLEEEGTQFDIETSKPYPTYRIWVYDGKAIKQYRPRERNTHPTQGVKETDAELGIGEGYLGGAGWTMSYWPLFAGHGSVANYGVRILAGQPMVLPKIEFMRVQGRGGHRGRNCLVIQTEPKDKSYEEWWIDLERESAVVRYVMFLNNKPYVVAEVEHEKTASGWMPKSWVFTMQWTLSGMAQHLERMVVEKREIDPKVSDEDYQIAEKPGMRVIRYRYPEPSPGNPQPASQSKTFRVQENGKLQEVSLEDGVETPVNRYSWWWLALIPAIGLGAWPLLRWRKSRRGIS